MTFDKFVEELGDAPSLTANDETSITTNYKSFHFLEDGEVIFSNLETIKSSKKLDSGYYKLDYTWNPDRLLLHKTSDKESAKNHSFPDKDTLEEFFKSYFDERVKKRLHQLGFNHKVGILFHGKEGTGKTTIMKHYCDRFIKDREAIVFQIDHKYDGLKFCWNFARDIRKIQNNPIIIVIDEFDEYMDRHEGLLKTILDGGLSVDNCIFMASTNYIDKIPKALSDRPSRFKFKMKIEGMEDKQEIKAILDNMLEGLKLKDSTDVLAGTLIGKTLDEIKQFCLDKIMNLKSYTGKQSKIGFNK